MAEIENSIAQCCKQLRLSTNFAGQALTLEGDTPQKYLLNLLENEISYRIEKRKSKYLNTAGFPRRYRAEEFKTDEIDFPDGRNGSQLLFDYLSEIHEQKSVILNTNLEFSQWVNVLYDQRMTTALIGRLTHHVELILFPGVNNRLRESSINETLSKINSQNG